MTINELILKTDSELTDKQKIFLNTHNEIITCGVVVVNGLVSLAQNLKKMRDEKLYVEAGFSSFEEYSEKACGLKQRQAYNYIKILEDFGEDFLHSNAKIGVSKLTLLSSLAEEERVEILENVKIDDVTVSQLKEEISRLKQELENRDNEILDTKNVELESAKKEISRLKKEIKDIVGKEQNSSVRDSDDKAKEKIKDLQEKLKKKSDELESALSKIKETSDKAMELGKQIELNADKKMVEFKIKFEALQVQINDVLSLLPTLPKDKIEGCRNALKKVVEGLC